jgi:formylglycine-generating enzyme required for sulfatase activity
MDESNSCCSPTRNSDGRNAHSVVSIKSDGALQGKFVLIPEGEFTMGVDKSPYIADGEGPQRQVWLHPYEISVTTVTNEEFEKFVSETGYITDAENYGWSYVFEGLLKHDHKEINDVKTPIGAPWWIAVAGANWRNPFGDEREQSDFADHPVVHVSHNDSIAYCNWAGLRLPSEAEWEKAARGGLENCEFPWGKDFLVGGSHNANTWQGVFPNINTCDDGFFGTAPSISFEPNGYGIYNMIGNVWEWTSDSWSVHWHKKVSLETRRNPKGPDRGHHQKVLKGGSYLCHESYCLRYRNSARSRNLIESSTGHTGFRCVRDLA